MANDDKNAPKGFAGLEDMVSDPDAPIPAGEPEPTSAPPRTLPTRGFASTTTKPQNTKAIVGTHNSITAPSAIINKEDTASAKPKSMFYKKLLGASVVVYIFLAIFMSANERKTKPSTPPAVNSTTQSSKQASQTAPAATSTAPTYLTEQEVFGTTTKTSAATSSNKATTVAAPTPKYFYKLRASDGVIIEVEGPPKANDAQLHQIALHHWMPKETYPREDRPSGGYGQALDDDQIRYCLSQKIRLGGWEKTVDSYSGSSVDSFNSEVKDFNSRCGNYKYRKGAVERVQAEVDGRFFELEKDGRAHKGPRVPVPAKFTRISVRVVGPPQVQGAAKRKGSAGVANASPTSFTDQHHSRCAGSYEVEKCEEFARQMDQETTQQKQSRQLKLDAERQRNMAEVNGIR